MSAPWLLLCLFVISTCASATHPDHHEFEATLHAPYRGAPHEARTFTLSFDYPFLTAPQQVRWRLQLLAPGGALVRQWQGQLPLFDAELAAKVDWDGLLDGVTPAPGIYRVQLDAQAGGEAVEQSWEIAIGDIAAPVFPLDAAATPYKVYLGNLHSQTGHSDGGGDLATCKGAQAPQSSKQGPAEAYAFARQHGLDLLVTSEHNHMYDGSDGTNLAADPLAAKALFRAGLAAAGAFNAAHPGFLGVYALEWGVIDNGGHMNIFNSGELLGWERNGAGQLIADRATAKSDYAALYKVMRQRGWIGQFNHPALNGQFKIGKAGLGYSRDGDAVLALCEVVNSNAFSTRTDEGETRRGNFEFACNKALEAGYHVAFSSDQDNHCANWGASFSNRTGVLIPIGTPLTMKSFLAALSARRVFATMDKGSQLVFTANGHMMGQRFDNRGPLNLAVRFASTAGKAASTVAIMEGVPGRNGTVSQLSANPTATITPAKGEHFYYAKVIQQDGNMLWSAPVWVRQR